MVLERWNPFNELRQMHETMNRLFWNTFQGEGVGSEAWLVPVDVIEEGDKIVVQASLPGVQPENIQATIEDGVLTIRAEAKAEHEAQGSNYLMRERRFGSFYRALRLPDSVATDGVECRYEHGVLTVTFPKLESKRAKQLTINVGSQPQAIEARAA